MNAERQVGCLGKAQESLEGGEGEPRQDGGVTGMAGDVEKRPYPEFLKAECDSCPFLGLQLLEVGLREAHLGHHGSNRAVWGQRGGS